MFDHRYQNYIAGEWVAPKVREWFANVTPVTGSPFCEVSRATGADVEHAVAAARAAAPAWAMREPYKRAEALSKIAERIERELEALAVAETWDNGKPIRESLGFDLPMVVALFRYHASCLHHEAYSAVELDHYTTLHRIRAPLGVVGITGAWSFPLLSAASALAPALAAGNAAILVPARETPASTLELVKLIGDCVPPGVVNVVTGVVDDIHRVLHEHPNVATVVTGSRVLGGYDDRCTSHCPNLFFDDIFSDDSFFGDKALEGFALFAFNKGEAPAAPSRALIQRSFFEQFLERAIERIVSERPGHPLASETTVGAVVSRERFESSLQAIDDARARGTRLWCGGQPEDLPGELARGFYLRPTVFETTVVDPLFGQRLGGPVATLTPFGDEDEALALANGSGTSVAAGVWTRDLVRGYRVGRGLRSEWIWVDCYHRYTAPELSTCSVVAHSRTGADVLKRQQRLIVGHGCDPMGLF